MFLFLLMIRVTITRPICEICGSICERNLKLLQRILKLGKTMGQCTSEDPSYNQLCLNNRSGETMAKYVRSGEVYLHDWISFHLNKGAGISKNHSTMS